MEVLGREASWRVQRPTRHRRSKLAQSLTLSARHAICLHGGFVLLAAEFLTELTKELGRECVAFLPDLDHALQFLLLISRQAFHYVVKQSWHELRDALDGGRIRAGLAAAFDVQLLPFELCLLDPSPHDAINHVDGTKLMCGGRLLQRAVE